MKIILKGGHIYRNREIQNNESIVFEQSDKHSDLNRSFDINNKERVINIGNSFILPAFCDVHVHFREPGYEYKETIRTGTLAAAHGGYSTVCTMPNLKPAPADMVSLRRQLEIIKKDAVINVIPYGTITNNQSGRGVLSEMDEICSDVLAFSDDGKGIQSEELMRKAMTKAASLGKIITAHCEDEEILKKGQVRKSEWKQIERDIEISEETGCAYHVCHISTEESVQIIREAKKRGVNVTCETAPHYLILNDEIIKNRLKEQIEDGGRYKMNPPVKTEQDRLALIEGIKDGTIDMIATDHAPHSKEEKATGFEKSLNGVVGLECAFPVLYTELVMKDIITLEKLVELMSVNPRERFGIGEDNSYVVVNTDNEYQIDSDRFKSKGRSTPFEDMKVLGEIEMTICDGKIVYGGNKWNDQ